MEGGDGRQSAYRWFHVYDVYNVYDVRIANGSPLQYIGISYFMQYTDLSTNPSC
jgi:hypothetical protein